MQSRVTPEAIVKDFNVFKDVSFSLGFGLVMAMMNQLCFQGVKETFHWGIVVTIASAAHTTLPLIFGQQGLIIFAGVLTAPVRVMQQAGGRLAHGNRHLQRGDNQVAFQAVAHGPADNPARVQVHLSVYGLQYPSGLQPERTSELQQHYTTLRPKCTTR